MAYRVKKYMLHNLQTRNILTNTNIQEYHVINIHLINIFKCHMITLKIHRKQNKQKIYIHKKNGE